MRNTSTGAVAALIAALIFSSVALAQAPQSSAPKNPWKYYPTDVPTGDGGPAPKRDLSGTWNGPGSSPAVPRGGGAERPELTPLAQQIISTRKSVGSFGPAGTNDPTARFCDPVGYPANITNEGRALQIASAPNKVIILYQYMQVWREIWTDGRALPTDVGGSSRDSLDPTFEGYSVGHWEDDYNFVVDTTGLDERTWMGRDGTPHSANVHIQERWTRIDHNNMKLSVTVDDPKMFKKPYSMGTFNYKWNPNQKLNEWFCVPSEQIKYLSEQGDPAGYPDQPQNGRGGGGAAGGGAGAGAGAAGGAGRAGGGGRGGAAGGAGRQ